MCINKLEAYLKSFLRLAHILKSQPIDYRIIEFENRKGPLR